MLGPCLLGSLSYYPTAKLCLLAGALLLAAGVRTANCAEDSEDTIIFHGPAVHPGYPDAFSTDYFLPKDTVSPNGKYGLIFPDRELSVNPGRDFIVALDPPQILTLLETDEPEFEGMSHGGYSLEWSGDSSVALVTLDGKWGPRDFLSVLRLEPRFGALARGIKRDNR